MKTFYHFINSSWQSFHDFLKNFYKHISKKCQKYSENSFSDIVKNLIIHFYQNIRLRNLWSLKGNRWEISFGFNKYFFLILKWNLENTLDSIFFCWNLAKFWYIWKNAEQQIIWLIWFEKHECVLEDFFLWICCGNFSV